MNHEVFSIFPSEAFPPSQKKNNPKDEGAGGNILFVFLQFLLTPFFYDWKSVAGLFMIITIGFRIMLAYSFKYFFPYMRETQALNRFL